MTTIPLADIRHLIQACITHGTQNGPGYEWSAKGAGLTIYVQPNIDYLALTTAARPGELPGQPHSLSLEVFERLAGRLQNGLQAWRVQAFTPKANSKLPTIVEEIPTPLGESETQALWERAMQAITLAAKGSQ